MIIEEAINTNEIDTTEDNSNNNSLNSASLKTSVNEDFSIVATLR